MAEDRPAQEMATRAGMSLISRLLENVLPLPGMAVSLTGRAPELTYKLLTTMHCSPLFAQAVLLDAFKHSHVCEMLNGQYGSTKVSLRDALGLRSDEEVSELARYVLFHTGGMARLVAALFEFLLMERLLQTEKRKSEQDGEELMLQLGAFMKLSSCSQISLRTWKDIFIEFLDTTAGRYCYS